MMNDVLLMNTSEGFFQRLSSAAIYCNPQEHLELTVTREVAESLNRHMKIGVKYLFESIQPAYFQIQVALDSMNFDDNYYYYWFNFRDTYNKVMLYADMNPAILIDKFVYQATEQDRYLDVFLPNARLRNLDTASLLKIVCVSYRGDFNNWHCLFQNVSCDSFRRFNDCVRFKFTPKVFEEENHPSWKIAGF